MNPIKPEKHIAPLMQIYSKIKLSIAFVCSLVAVVPAPIKSISTTAVILPS